MSRFSGLSSLASESETIFPEVENIFPVLFWKLLFPFSERDRKGNVFEELPKIRFFLFPEFKLFVSTFADFGLLILLTFPRHEINFPNDNISVNFT